MLSRVGYGVGVALRATAMPVALGVRLAQHKRSEGEPGIPAPEWNLRLASKVALDDFFFASELASATIVSLKHRGRIAREISEGVALFGARGWLADPGSYHRAPPAPRRVRVDEVSTRIGVYSHLRYESRYEPHAGEPGRDRWLGYEANSEAHAWVLRHPGEEQPWVVCVPGYRMGQPSIDLTSFKARWLHHNLGLNVAIPVLPLHGPRSMGRRGGDGFLSGDFVDTVHAQAQAVWDIRRLIRWLREGGAPTIAVHGVSLGGYTAALLAGVEEDIDCIIAGIPATDFVRLIRSHLPPFALKLADRFHFPFDDLERLLRVVSPLAIPPQVPRNRRFIYAGTADSLTVPTQARDLWRHWQRPRLAWYQGSHVSFLWEAEVRSLIREALEAGGLLEPETHRADERPARSARSPATT